MNTNTDAICVNCGGHLRYYDSVHRITKSKGGKVTWIEVKRFRCMDCHRIHRELPSYIYPYKQYKADIINGVRDGTITSDILGYEDYPCEMTMRRWTRN